MHFSCQAALARNMEEQPCRGDPACGCRFISGFVPLRDDGIRGTVSHLETNEHEHSCDVAIIGAGPYGLSLAAHLAVANINLRIFGKTLDTWRHHMPKDMLLKSDGFASNISAPGRCRHAEDLLRRARHRLCRSRHAGVAGSLHRIFAGWFQQRSCRSSRRTM